MKKRQHVFPMVVFFRLFVCFCSCLWFWFYGVFIGFVVVFDDGVGFFVLLYCMFYIYIIVEFVGPSLRPNHFCLRTNISWVVAVGDKYIYWFNTGWIKGALQLYRSMHNLLLLQISQLLLWLEQVLLINVNQMSDCSVHVLSEMP